MKIYKNLFWNEINNLTEKKRILLHSCCGPCSSPVIELLSKYFDITILYYNPNISPFEEYVKRKNEQLKFIYSLKNVNFIDSNYDNELYNTVVKGLEKEKEGGKRCYHCFVMRLEKTAEIASKYGFDYFCTTLTVSPYKNAALINEIGEKLQNKYGIKWLFSDFKKDNGYKRSIELSNLYGMYRQNYCGCIYSKK